jgi:hypothetical protein
MKLPSWRDSERYVLTVTYSARFLLNSPSRVSIRSDHEECSKTNHSTVSIAKEILSAARLYLLNPDTIIPVAFSIYPVYQATITYTQIYKETKNIESQIAVRDLRTCLELIGKRWRLGGTRYP